jgi:putative transposase
VSWTDVQPARAIVDGRVDAVAESLMAVLSGLSDDALQESQDKQEVVLTMRTGFARGHPALARPGEPYSLFLGERRRRAPERLARQDDRRQSPKVR